MAAAGGVPQASPPLSPTRSHTSPSFPPGFPSPRFAGRALVLQLFPQLAGSQDLGDSPPRAASTEAARVDSRRSSSARSAAMEEGEKVVRKVSFAPLQLVPVRPLMGTHGAPRPCIKSPGSSRFGASVLDALVECESSPVPAGRKTGRVSSPAVIAQAHPSSFSSQRPRSSSDEDWQLVRAPYWWRRQEFNKKKSRNKPWHPSGRAGYSRGSSRPAPYQHQPHHRPFVKPNRRRCRNCLERGHPAAECRDPVRCSKCRGWRHLARDCKGDHAGSSSCKAPARRADEHDRHRWDGDLSRRRVGNDHRDRDHRRRGDDRSRTQRLCGSRSRPADKRYDERRGDRRDDRREDRRGGRDDQDGGRRHANSVIHTQSGSDAALVSPVFGSAELPPPPPLPMSGPMPKRLFTPTILQRPAVRAAVQVASSQASPSPAPRLAGPMLDHDRAASPPDESSPARMPVHSSAPTPSPSRGPPHAPSPSPLTPLFVPIQAPLLQAPSSTPPRRPAARRKTLAGVSSFDGFQVQRSSPRLRAKKTKMPIAKLAEKVLCHRLGIVAEGEQVTEAAIAKFILMFDGKLPDIAIAALRALFRLDCDFTTAVEDALVQFGGAAAVDHAGDLAPAGSGQA